MKKLLILVVLLAGCGNLNETYIRSERATYDVIGPQFRQYVITDDTLDVQVKDSWLRLESAWRMGLEAAEQDLAVE